MRVIINNEKIEMAFDEYSGELRELTYLETGENIFKNYIWKRKTPFTLLVCFPNGEKKTLTAPLYDDIAKDYSLKPAISLSELQNGTKLLQIIYKHLKCETGRINISAGINVTLSPDDYESIWTIEIINNEADHVVEEVWFPFLSGIYLGDTWEDDVLVFPSWSAIKVPNPTAALSSAPTCIGWRWHDYNYEYRIGMSVPAVKTSDGSYCLQAYHSGSASMNWMSYYGNEFGLYMAAYQDDFKISNLAAETFGNERPGMGFSVTVYPHIVSGNRWMSKKYGVALHPGDWHWGADRYRRWRNSIDNGLKHKTPDWFEKSPGLIAHYDFKYQHQFMKPVHKYSDIERLYGEAKELGINHLLISGWHKDGFDRGFPLYRYEPELGSEDEFSKHVTSVVENGGHISFYINSRLFNRKYEKELNDLWTNGHALKKDGKTHDENYGSEEFSVMCASSKAWQEHLLNTIKYLVEKIGGDGVYLDQLNCSSPIMCFNDNHGHEHDDWNKGYDKLLDEINSYFLKNSENSISIICEGASDIHGCKMSGQLISTFFNNEYGAFPEAYKYTFPEETLVDMIYPSRGRQIMRPVHVSRNAYKILNRAFLTGSYFWIYDLEEENTFKYDPEMKEYLKNVIKLRKLWLEKFGKGIYQDDRGIIFAEESINAKIYLLDNNDILVALYNNNIQQELRIVLDVNKRKVKECLIYQLGGDKTKLNVEIEDGNAVIITKTDHLALIHLAF
ncbi:MAG: hypothetical protein GYA02_17420, partial [Clostridiaceae bacterium]|nr:hypothetical protein [Clostridiaceae bacterium]